MTASLDLLLALLTAPVFLWLRIYPIWPQRDRGCDAYNILLCARALRRSRRLPVKLPDLFILEKSEQWYPPGYLVLCAFIPEKWLENKYWAINHIIDLLSCAAIILIIYYYNPVGYICIIIAVLYAIQAGLVQEFSNFNTRPLGLLLFNGLTVAILMESWWLAILFGILLFYSHKLSMQQAWFTLPLLSAATGKLEIAALLPAIYALSFAVWPRGFREIAKGHLAIVKFWSSQWPRLGAHQVRQSPLYGDGYTRNDVYRPQSGAAVRFLKDVFHDNYFIVPALAFSWELHNQPGPWLLLVALVLSVYIASAAIHFIPSLRGIGMGRQYIKFALAPSLILSGVGFTLAPSPWAMVTFIAATGLTIRQYWRVTINMRTSKGGGTSQSSPELTAIMEHIKAIPGARVMTIPTHLSDYLAYATGRQVYWGGHAQIFDQRFADFFPVLRLPLSQYAARDALTHLLLDHSYAHGRELGLDKEDVVLVAGDYALYRFKPDARDKEVG